MRNTKPIRAAFCVSLAACMIFSSGISTFAENSISAYTGKEAPVSISADNHKHYLEEAVVKLMQEGKLTKEKTERILEFKKKRAEELSKLTKEQREQMKKQCKKGSLLKELKQQGIITDAEAQLIKAKLHEMKEERLTTGLQGLVEKGVLTATDVDNMRSYMLKVREERKAKIEKLKEMTPEQRKAYFKEHKGERKDILSRMVEDKVITGTQAEEIRKAVPELSKSKFKKPRD